MNARKGGVSRRVWETNMLQIHANDIRSRLRLTASALVVAAAGLGASAADAQTVNVASGGTYVLDNGLGTTVYHVGSGVTAQIVPNYATADNSAWAALTWASPILSTTSGCLYSGCTPKAAAIVTDAGSTLILPNPWWWMDITSMFTVNGTMVFQPGSGTGITGTNYFNGDVVLQDGAGVNFGEGWIYSNNYFGTATNIIMGSGTAITFNEVHTVVNVINTIQSKDTSAAITFTNGSMTVNGKNTTATPYSGSVTINAGASFIVGDATHASAVFGDPNASAATITVNQSGGTVGSLKGYGTIYGSIVNNSLVAPGGTSGTAGTLAVVGSYTQSSTGEFVAEVTPTGVSKMTVAGTANLAGTLLLKIDDGKYTTPALYDILTATTVNGSFSATNLQGNAAFVGTVKTANGYRVAVESQNSAQTFAHMATTNRYQVEQLARALSDRSDGLAAAPGKWVGWLTPYGNVENIGRNGIGFNNTTYGVRGGVEYHPAVQNAIIGVAASYGSSSLDAKGESSSADIDTYNAAIYGGADLLYARLDGSLFVSKFDTAITRNLGSSLGAVNASPSGSTYGASVKLSSDLFRGLITPFASGYFARVHLDDTTEGGNASFALRYNDINRNYLDVDLGVKVHAIRRDNLLVDVSVAVEHDFSDRGETASASFANITGSSATYLWKGDAENTLIAGLYVADKITDKVDLFGRIDGEFSLYKRAADFSAGVKYHF
jgi:hypothetical protein